MKSKGFTLQGRSNDPRSGGFTLVELLVVISILAVLAAIGFTAYLKIFQNARDTKRQSDIKSMQSAFEQYHADSFRYPDSLPASGSLSNGSKVYLSTIPKDPKPDPGLDYKYTALNCTSGTNCQNYCLYAKMENPSLSTMPSACTSGAGGYNFAVTKP